MLLGIVYFNNRYTSAD